MISYELALKLKEAGFPPPEEEKGMQSWVLQETFGAAYAKGLDNIFRLFPGCVYCPDALTYIPTLSELIEACPVNIIDIGNPTNRPREFRLSFNGWTVKWVACYEYYDETTEYLSEGSTPSEAVAKLWLKLHEEKK